MNFGMIFNFLLYKVECKLEEYKEEECFLVDV